MALDLTSGKHPLPPARTKTFGLTRSQPSGLPSKTALFTVSVATLIAIFRAPLGAWWRQALASDSHSYTAAVPFIVVALLCFERRRIFRQPAFSAVGLPIILLGIAMSLFHPPSLDAALLSWLMTGFVLLVVAAFLSFFGLRVARNALFATLFLFLMVPLPGSWLQALMTTLQRGSAALTGVFFTISNVAVLRHGFDFQLAGFTIHVAQECSGIRSTTALLLTSLLAGHLFLRASWSRMVLLLIVLPITVTTNGFRIALLTWLALNVDRGFLFGRLHREGGVLFFLMGVAILLAILRLLQSLEARWVPAGNPSPA